MNSHNIKQILLVFLVTVFLAVQTFAAIQTNVNANDNTIQQAPVPVTPAPVEDPNNINIPVAPVLDPNNINIPVAPVLDPNSIPVSPAPVEDPNSIPVSPAPVEDPNSIPVSPAPIETPVIINPNNNGGNTGGNPGGGNGRPSNSGVVRTTIPSSITRVDNNNPQPQPSQANAGLPQQAAANNEPVVEDAGFLRLTGRAIADLATKNPIGTIITILLVGVVIYGVVRVSRRYRA